MRSGCRDKSFHFRSLSLLQLSRFEANWVALGEIVTRKCWNACLIYTDLWSIFSFRRNQCHIRACTFNKWTCMPLVFKARIQGNHSTNLQYTLPSEECIHTEFSLKSIASWISGKKLHLCQWCPLWVQVLHAGAMAENKMVDTLLLRLQL